MSVRIVKSRHALDTSVVDHRISPPFEYLKHFQHFLFLLASITEVQTGHVFEACGPTVDVFEGDRIMLKE